MRFEIFTALKIQIAVFKVTLKKKAVVSSETSASKEKEGYTVSQSRRPQYESITFIFTSIDAIHF
jgi:hypothetical protein